MPIVSLSHSTIYFIRMFPRFLLTIILAVTVFSGSLFAQDEADYELMPIEAIQPGMEGVWKTVVSGNEIRTFPLRVIGIAEHFVGPRQSVIICEATDAENNLSGPVAGMSGSPVFIDGKLIGAYAYGFTWPKEQALIGVTPIHDMLPIFDSGEPYSESSGDSVSMGSVWKNVEPASRNKLVEFQTVLKPLPTPMFVSGISETALGVFGEEFEKLGLSVMAAPMGGSGDVEATPFEAGSALAGVLMQGDFNYAAVGTVTHVVGNRLLAFGHPFFQWGDIQVPLAHAEVLTVVRSLSSSFKLSNYGEIVGQIYQDRLNGIAGEVGTFVPMSDFNLSVKYPDFSDKEYSAKLFHHKQLSAILSATALMQALNNVHESSAEQTLLIETRIKPVGYDEIVLNDIFAGGGASIMAAFQQMSIHQLLTDNNFDSPAIESINIEVRVQAEERVMFLEGVYLESNDLNAGDELTLTIKLKNNDGERFTENISFLLPEGVRSEKLELVIGDASTAEENQFEGFFSATRYEHLLEGLVKFKSRDQLYIQLVRRAPGISMGGSHLSGLPPSVLTLIKNSKSLEIEKDLKREVLYEQGIKFESEIRGSASLSLTVN